jgi:hypothetical protein
MRKRLIHVISALIVLLFLTQSGRSTNRDLSLYAKAGPYNLRINSARTYERYQRATAEIREFFWMHWQNRQRGYITFTKYSIEGDSSTFHFFIEPHGDGWATVARIERRLSRRTGVKSRRETVHVTYDDMDRIEPVRNRSEPVTVIPNNEKRNPRDYLLRLRNRQTNDEAIY